MHEQLSVLIQHRYRNRGLVDIQTNIFHTLHGAFLSEGVGLLRRAQQPQPTRKRRPFIMRGCDATDVPWRITPIKTASSVAIGPRRSPNNSWEKGPAHSLDER